MQTTNQTTPSPAELKPVFRLHAELCKALANEHRLAILYDLSQGEKCVSDLAAEIGISVHLMSQHLRLLKERQLVNSRKEGQTVYYSISNPKFIQGCTLIRQALIEEHQARGESLVAAELLDAIQHMPLPTASDAEQTEAVANSGPNEVTTTS
jgi:DNA-binding transcriptional ArsR family regulator